MTVVRGFLYLWPSCIRADLFVGCRYFQQWFIAVLLLQQKEAGKVGILSQFSMQAIAQIGISHVVSSAGGMLG